MEETSAKLTARGGKKGFKGDEVGEAGRGHTMKSLYIMFRHVNLNMKARP